jgi:regulator of RNase E activity RraA
VGDFIDDVEPGSVIVLDNGGRRDVTVWGDLLTTTAACRGLAGTVIHGVCRDTARILQLHYPVFSRGAYMRTGKGRVRAEDIQGLVSLGTASVEPGDLVVADSDGVVVVPREHEEEVLALALEISRAEERIRAAVEAGGALREAREEAGYHRLQDRGMSGETTTRPEVGRLHFEHRGGTYPVSYSHRVGHQETLFYFHGLGSTKEDFRGAWDVPDWSEHTLVAFDAPGCGSTGGYRHGVPLGVDDVVSTAEALVEHLGLRDLTVIGHSMGGLAGLLFTLRHTDGVRRFVSVEGNLGPEDCNLYSRRVFRERFLGREDEFMTDLVQELQASRATGLPEAAGALRENVQDRAFFDYCRSIVEYSDHVPLLDKFLALAIPKLYVHGAENAHPSRVRRMGREGVKVCSVPHSNHFPVASNPDFYFRVLVDFIEET